MEYDKGASLYPVFTPTFLKTVNNSYIKINENKTVSYPKGIRSALKMPQVPPRRLEPNWLDFYFFITTNVATPLISVVLPHKKQFNTAIYTNLLHALDMKYREKRFIVLTEL